VTVRANKDKWQYVYLVWLARWPSG